MEGGIEEADMILHKTVDRSRTQSRHGKRGEFVTLFLNFLGVECLVSIVLRLNFQLKLLCLYMVDVYVAD